MTENGEKLMKVLSTILLALVLFAMGCSPPRNTVNKNQNSVDGPNGPGSDGGTPSTPAQNNNNNDPPITPSVVPLPIPNSGSTTGSSTQKCYDPGVADADQSINYLELPVKGAGNGNSGAQWSSALHISESNASENIFVADSRVHVRIVAKEAPSRGGRCRAQTSYSRLSMKLSIWGQNSTAALQTLEFKNIKVGECTEVLRFTRIPNNSEDNPFILKIHDVTWDADCRWDPIGTEGCDPSNPSAEANFNPVWTGHCWGIELQMATDDTKDIPR